ncbi:agrin-like isoform X2 [Dreissena polymorpha]|uniref:agrin-like isoform X2 n=1 Tax=Dreissena polymorpha TaxID=45954 RepID=UPI0022642A64|nr:agrin-like isoform X2 [Dreissena polymorpha]
MDALKAEAESASLDLPYRSLQSYPRQHFKCHFAKAYCANAKVTFVRDGTCLSTPSPTTTTTTTTTPSPPTQSSSDVLKEVFCNNQQAINCQTGFNVVCGSDGNLYPNPCEFSKAVCNLSGLTRMPDTSTCYPL